MNHYPRGTILAVDDDSLNLELLDELLSDASYAVHLASDGEEGLQWLLDNPDTADVVLLDRMMPGMDGLEVLQKMKEDATLERIPVIFQTAKSSEEAIREGLEAGAFYYITKPFDEESLLAVVSTAVEERRAFLRLQEEVRKTTGALQLLKEGRFELTTLEQALDLSALLSNLSADPDKVVVGLSELLINAVEHGNLEISYDEKGKLNLEGKWQKEVEARLALPKFRDRRVKILFTRNESEIRFFIEDEGRGFDWEQYLEFSPERAFDSHGRGIAMSRMMSFTSLEYQGRGNQVVATVALEPETPLQ
uniref:Response regulator receiver protein n=1 Tax=Magnetococcus massalia (strain MO-1) TaxID=451514 RepID=A0A1S7LGV2_MAGMO|nr:Response regulator receiver protein [Candidatus Magnetococcus massalia]